MASQTADGSTARSRIVAELGRMDDVSCIRTCGARQVAFTFDGHLSATDMFRVRRLGWYVSGMRNNTSDTVYVAPD